MHRTTNHSVIPERLLKRSVYETSGRFEVVPEPTCPFGDGISKDIIVSHDTEKLRGSPSLVGRGIANPMSERTRGFEMSRGDS